MKHGKVVLGILAILFGMSTGATLHAATQTVVVGTYFFNPANVSIFQGDTIIWTNRSTITHDSTQGAGSTPDSQRLWKSPNLPALLGNYRFTFTNAGVYPYVCLQHISLHPEQTGTVSVAGGNLPPSVAMTAPSGGSRHPAPPNFLASATASDPDGTVTNVFFTATATAIGTVTLGSDPSPPYSVLVTNLAPASYQFRAVAMDNEGVSITSAVVNVLIAMPVPLQLTLPARNGAQFEFDIATTFGLSYVVEESRSLDGGWTGVVTNAGTGNPMKVTRPFDPASPTQRLYRAFIQP